VAHLTLDDVRELSEWRPPFGVVSVYLGFDPGDRGAPWRTILRNGVDHALDPPEDADHERKIAVRETARRLLDRFEQKDVESPPRGEAGFIEVSRNKGLERWWGTGVAPAIPGVLLGDRPTVVQLVDLCRRGEGCGIALLSAERVRLLRFDDWELEELEDWELSVASREWRERKARSTYDPTRARGVSASGHDQYEERLDNNRRRFLVGCGHRARERLGQQGLAEVVAFGPPADAESFLAGLGPTPIKSEIGGEADLISTPRGQLIETVSAAVERLAIQRDRDVVERALEEARGGIRGAVGLQETIEALEQRRVENVSFDAAIGEPGEELVRGAFAGRAEITVVRDGVAELLASAEGVAAILRY
jgi:hypothetical protein